jgi:hypothetical protein
MEHIETTMRQKEITVKFTEEEFNTVVMAMGSVTTRLMKDTYDDISWNYIDNNLEFSELYKQLKVLSDVEYK